MRAGHEEEPMLTGHNSRCPGRGDRGSVSVFVIFFTITVLALASLLVDLGNAVNAQERAADVAEQAARAAADSINLTALRAGTVAINTDTACASADQIIQTYASTSGIDAVMAPQGCTYQGPGPRQVTVYVSIKTTPIISTFFGSFTMTAHESACAEFGITQGVAC
jgi:Flp pilus assembly protein TadG